MDNSYIFAEERKENIVELVKRKKKVTVAELCQTFGVSGATVRSDLRELQKNGSLVRTHGGAIEKKQTGFELNANQKRIDKLAEKRIVANLALRQVADGDRIVLDTGTTTTELAVLLRQRKNLTVITNDLIIARIIEELPTLEVIFIGGLVRKHFHCTIGEHMFKFLSSLRVDKAFMGVNGFSSQQGATTPDIHQAQMKEAMVKIANKVYILCDSSKLGNVSFAKFASIEQVDTLIVDEISMSIKSECEESGIEVICEQLKE